MADKGPFDIKIKTVGGEGWTIPAYKKIKVSKIKLLLCDLLDLEDAKAPLLQISLNQQILEDDKKLGDYELKSGDFLALFIKDVPAPAAGQNPVVDPECEWCQKGQQVPHGHHRCPWCNPQQQTPQMWHNVHPQHPPHHHGFGHHWRHGGHGHGHRGRGRGWWRHHLLHFHGMPAPPQPQ